MPVKKHVDIPIQLVSMSENGKMLFMSEAKQKLQQIKGKVAVIACMGKYRTGKSYLMSRLSGVSRSFHIGSTCNVTTKGLWVMTKPHPYDRDNTLVLLDMEGLYDVSSGNADRDLKLSVATLLASSSLINNISYNLGYGDMVDLHKLLRLAKKWMENIKRAASVRFPHIHFLIRDHTLELMVGNQSFLENPDGYLEWLLQNRSKNNQSYNKLLLDIQSSFKSRSLHTMCRPSDDTAILATLDRVYDTKLKPEFIKECEDFVNAVVSNTKTFSIRGHECNMGSWLNYVEFLINNQESIPDIPTSSDAMVTEINRRANQDAVTEFREFCDKLMDEYPITNDYIKFACQLKMEILMEKYLKKSFDNCSTATGKMEDLKTKYMEMNDKRMEVVWLHMFGIVLLVGFTVGGFIAIEGKGARIAAFIGIVSAFLVFMPMYLYLTKN